MASSAALAGFKVSVDASDPESVERALSALHEARDTILKESKGLYVQCHGAECPASIYELLSGWGYQAIARIPASGTLCFARSGTVEITNGVRQAKPIGDSALGENLAEVRERATRGLKNNPAYRSARNLALDFRGLRPASLRARKLHKLMVSPGKFLRDSRYPILAGPGLWAFETIMLDEEVVAARKDVSIFDFPKRTLLLCVGEDCDLEMETISACSLDLGLRTEVVVLLSSAHAPAVHTVLAALRCPRARVYLMPDTTGEEMLRYGLARSYATNVAAIALPSDCDSEKMERAFSQLNRENDHFFDSEQGIVGARREVWRDYLGGERSDLVLTAGVVAFLKKISPSVRESNALVPLGNELEEFSQYPGVDPAEPFAAHSAAAPRVMCFDRKPQWPRPGSRRRDDQEILVSVIMTVYNAADTVAAAIDSVLGQTYRNIELLVIDDCSPDIASLRVLEEKAAVDSRVRVLQTARNSGTYYAKNIGLRFARGGFVTFHDSDDVSSLNRIELQAEALVADPDAIGNYTRYQRLSETGDEVWLNGRTNRPGYITLMLRREAAMEAAGFFDSVRVSADAEYVERIRIASKRPVRLLPAVCYFALQAEGSLTTAGAAAFGVDAAGRMTMSPVRETYRDAARQWHADIFDGMSSAVMPFPLETRPFFAPPEIRPSRG